MLLSGPLATRAAVLGMTQEPVRKAGQKVARSLSSATMTPLSHRLHCWIPRFGDEVFFPLTCAIFSNCELVLCKWPQSWNIPAAWLFRFWSSISPATSLQILDYWFFFLFVNSPQRCFIVWGKQQQKEKCHRTGKTAEHTADTRSLASQMS